VCVCVCDFVFVLSVEVDLHVVFYFVPLETTARYTSYSNSNMT